MESNGKDRRRRMGGQKKKTRPQMENRGSQEGISKAWESSAKKNGAKRGKKEKEESKGRGLKNTAA